MSFVEEATLRVNDDSSAAIKKINSVLKQMEASAKKLASTLKGLDKLEFDKSIDEAKKLERVLNSLASKRIKPEVTIDIRGALAQLDRIKAKSLNIKVGADTSEARSAIKAVSTKPLEISVRADTSYARAAISALQVKPQVIRVSADVRMAQYSLSLLKAKPLQVEVTADIKRAQAALSSLKSTPLNIKVNAASIKADIQKAISSMNGQTITVDVIANIIPARTAIQSLNGQTVMIGVNANPSMFKNAMKALAADLGQDVYQAVLQGLKRALSEGFKNADLADTKLQLQQNTPAQNEAISRGVTDFVAANRTKTTSQVGDLSRVEAEKISSEISGTLNADPKAIAAVLKELQATIKMQVGLGQNRDDAIASAFEFVKAAEASANIKSGDKFDPAKFSEFMSTLRKTGPEIGMEFTGAFVRGALKYLRGSKSGVAGEQLVTTLLANEETGTTASVGMNQLIKMMAGDQTSKKSIDKLVDLGLMTTKERQTGKVGKEKTTEIVPDKIVDEALLRENTPAWVRKYLIPAMEKSGLDPANKVDRAKFVGQLGGTTTAQDVVGQLIGRANDFLTTTTKILARTGTTEAVDQQTEASGVLALSGTAAQVQSLLGEISTSFNTILIPSLSAVSGALSSLGEFVQTPEGKPDPVKSGLVATGGIAATIGAIFGGSKLLQMFTGTGANTIAITGNTAATQANTAALLANAGMKNLPATVAGATAATSTAAATQLSKFTKIFGGAGVITGLIQAIQNSTEEGRKESVDSAKSFAREITRFFGNDELADRKDMPVNAKPDEAPAWVQAWNKSITENGAKISLAVQDGIKSFFASAKSASDAKATPAQITAEDTAAATKVDARVNQLIVEALDAARANVERNKGTGSTTDQLVGKTKDDLGIGAPELAGVNASIQTANASIQTATATVQSATAGAATTIQAAANTGASAIQAAGVSAAGSIASGIQSGAGALSGGIISGAQTAAGIIASAISSAAANVHINVQQSSKPLNTGGDKLGKV